LYDDENIKNLAGTNMNNLVKEIEGDVPDIDNDDFDFDPNAEENKIDTSDQSIPFNDDEIVLFNKKNVGL